MQRSQNDQIFRWQEARTCLMKCCSFSDNFCQSAISCARSISFRAISYVHRTPRESRPYYWICLEFQRSNIYLSLSLSLSLPPSCPCLTFFGLLGPPCLNPAFQAAWSCIFKGCRSCPVALLALLGPLLA